jgi:regulator of protease activity HflC (stomatin/prohibitin superfamily)
MRILVINPNTSEEMTSDIGDAARRYALGGVAVLGWGIMTVVTTIYIIGAGHIGVVYGFGGGKIVGSLNNGTHWVAPWREVKVANVQTQRTQFDFIGDDSAVSKESQAVYAKLRVNYHLVENPDPATCAKDNSCGKGVVWLYTNVGPDWFTKLVEGRAAQDFKEITATYSTPQITPNREQIRQKTLTTLKRELAPYSIAIEDVQIFNLHFADAYVAAIQDKQIAAQEALAAQSRATATINKAQGDASATLIQATAQAKSNVLLAKSVTPELIQFQAVQKLAPGVNTILLPSSSNFLLPSSIFGAGK